MKSAPVDQLEETVQGDLGLGTLPALIRRLHEERRTGTLHIRARDSGRRVHFQWGSVIFAGSDRKEDRLDQRLRKEGLVELETLQEARKQQEASGKRFGESLIALEALTEAELLAAVERQVRSIVTFLFSLSGGHYRFEEAEEPVEHDLVLDIPMREIILDGIRSMADPIALRIGVGAMTDYLHPGTLSNAISNVTSAEGFVLSRVDGRTSILDILSVSPLEEVDTLRSICALLAVGIVEAKPEASATPVSPEPEPEAPKPKPKPSAEPELAVSQKELSTEDKHETAEQRYQEGRRLFQKKRYHEAIGALMEAVRLDGSRASYHRLLGLSYARNPKWRASAIEHLEEATRLDESDTKALFLLGELYEQKGRAKDARDVFEKVLTLEPDHERAGEKIGKMGVLSRLKSMFKKSAR